MKLNNEDKLGIILFFIGIIYLLIMTYIGLTKQGLWYDEIYSIGIVQLPLSELYTLGTKDVHPLLYYLIFKVFFKVFSFINIVTVGKIVSLIPFYLIAILAITKVRKNFGLLTCGIFILAITSMPQLMFYGVELRMYSWALFFLTASFIYIIEILKNPSSKNWVILTILTIYSAYTHYFSAIGSFSLYLVLFIYILLYKKELIKKWFLSSLIAILSFIPWLFVVFGQFSNIEGNYWIDPINLNTIVSYVYYVLSPAVTFIKANELVAPSILGTIFLIGIIILIIYNLKGKFTLKNDYALIGLIAFILVPIIGIIASSFSPVFHQRYLIPVLGCFWLAISIYLSKTYSKKVIFIPVLILIIAIGIVGTIDFNNIEEQELEYTIKKNKTLQSKIGNGNIIFHDKFPLYFESSTYYLKDNHHLSFDKDISGNILKALEDPGIQHEINSGSKVYFIDGGKSNYQECVDAGLNLELVPINSTEKDVQQYKIYEIKVA